MKKIALLFSIVILMTSSINADSTIIKKEDMSYYKDFLRFLDLSGAKENQEAIVGKMFAQFKSMPNAKKEIFKDMEKIMASELDKLNKSLFPVYKKYLSHSDLLAIIKFYESDAGKRLVASQPSLLKDSFDIGSKWGRSVAERVLQK